MEKLLVQHKIMKFLKDSKKLPKIQTMLQHQHTISTNQLLKTLL